MWVAGQNSAAKIVHSTRHRTASSLFTRPPLFSGMAIMDLAAIPPAAGLDPVRESGASVPRCSARRGCWEVGRSTCCSAENPSYFRSEVGLLEVPGENEIPLDGEIEPEHNRF